MKHSVPNKIKCEVGMFIEVLDGGETRVQYNNLLCAYLRHGLQIAGEASVDCLVTA